MIRACAAGLAAAALGVAAWRWWSLRSGFYAFPATMIGFGIAHAMRAVAPLQRGPRLQLAALLLTMLALAVGVYLAVDALVHALAQAQKVTTVGRLVSPALFWRAFAQLASAKDGLFFGAGLLLAILVPRRKSLPNLEAPP